VILVVTVLTAKREMEDLLLGIPGVAGVGVNWASNAIRVYVEKFTPTLDRTIPYWISGFKVEVIVTGKFVKRMDAALGGIAASMYRKLRWRPYYGGVSAGHFAMSAGTVGAIVRDNQTGEKMLLSNNHVFANTSTDLHAAAQVGDPILQPGTFDGGIPADVVATLDRYVPMVEGSDNLVDAAIAMPLDPGDAEEYVMGEGFQSDPMSVRGIGVMGTSTVTDSAYCKKFGRTSGYTTGYVIDSEFTTNVEYGGKTIKFVDQLLMAMRVEGGDSGSLVLDERDHAIGLVIAAAQTGDVTYSVANKIRNVMTMLDIDVPVAPGDVVIKVFDTPPIEDPTVVTSKVPAILWLVSGAVAGMIIFGGRDQKSRS